MRLPSHGPCPVCSPQGMGIPLDWDEAKAEITADFSLDERQQGPPRHAHGGISAAIIDEGMGASVWCAGHRVVAAHLEFDYRRPVPLDLPLRLIARAGSKSGRRVRAEGEIRRADDDTVLVQGTGIFVEAPHIFEEHGFGWHPDSITGAGAEPGAEG